MTQYIRNNIMEVETRAIYACLQRVEGVWRNCVHTATLTDF